MHASRLLTVRGLEHSLTALRDFNPSSTNSEDVQVLVEDLAQVSQFAFTLRRLYANMPVQWLSVLRPESSLYRRALRRMQALCRYSKHLPESCHLRGSLELVDDCPVSQTALSDVYRGRYGQDDVAVKAIRVWTDVNAKVEDLKVAEFAVYHLVLLNYYRRTMTRWCSGPI